MSQPCRYVIIENGAWTAVDFDRGGYETDLATALGPDVALATIRAWIATGGYRSTSTWERPHYANEGALIDVDRRLFLVNTEQLDPAERAAYRRMLVQTWPGWRTMWAYQGWSSFVDYLGLEKPPAEPVSLSWLRTDRPHPDPAFASFDAYGRHVAARYLARGEAFDPEPYARPLSVRGPDGLVRCYAMGVDDAWYGPALLDLLPNAGDVAFTRPARFGLHLDVASRTAGMWAGDSYPEVYEQWPRVWPGWALELWEDRFDEQARRTDGRWVWPPLDEAAGRAAYAARLDGLWPAWIAGRFPEHPVVVQAVPAATGLTEDRYRELRDGALEQSAGEAGR